MGTGRSEPRRVYRGSKKYEAEFDRLVQVYNPQKRGEAATGNGGEHGFTGMLLTIIPKESEG